MQAGVEIKSATGIGLTETCLLAIVVHPGFDVTCSLTVYVPGNA